MNSKLILTGYFEYTNVKNKIKFFLRKIFLCLFLNYDFLYEDADVVFYNSQFNRNDYVNLFSSIYESCQSKKAYIHRKRFFSIALINFFKLFGYFINKNKYKKILMDNVENYKICRGTLFIIHIYSLIYDKISKRFIKKIRKHHFNTLVVFYDVNSNELALIDACRKSSITTVLCQHAMFVPSEKAKTLHNLNFLHVNCDYVLTWGDKTSDLFRLHNDKLITNVCGNPILEKRINGENNYFTIALDIPEFKYYNQQLIDIANKFASKHHIKFRIRKHPVDDSEYIYNKDNLYDDGKDFLDSKFILTHTSTMIFNCLLEGKKVYRFKSEIRNHNLPREITFTNEDELEDCIKAEYDFSFVNEYIKYIGNESKEQYSLFFKSLEK